jgi:D-alanyl-lipoteichoic acid acyltransferase DltB (MBOAT superfamily)
LVDFTGIDFVQTFALPEIILPLAISFYTFQLIGFQVDAGRKNLPERIPFSDFCLFIFFFPQLIAGPILRGHQFFHQIKRDKSKKPVALNLVFYFVLSGIAKKVLIADNLAPLAEEIFANPKLYTPQSLMLGLYIFSIQLYCDFSGYTDMARGMALIFGYHLPSNFSSPYFSASLAEFWRNWHKTLSQWLRDYVYFPLGGSKISEFRTCFNLFLTMVLAGVWHGANYTFLIWGALHGLGLVIERFLARYRIWEDIRVVHILKILFTFHLILFSFILFRADNISVSWDFTQSLLTGLGTNNITLPKEMGLFVILFLVLHWIEGKKSKYILWRPKMEPVYLAVGILLFFLISSAHSSTSTFIYFQF